MRIDLSDLPGNLALFVSPFHQQFSLVTRCQWKKKKKKSKNSATGGNTVTVSSGWTGHVGHAYDLALFRSKILGSSEKFADRTLSKILRVPRVANASPLIYILDYPKIASYLSFNFSCASRKKENSSDLLVDEEESRKSWHSRKMGENFRLDE